MDWDTDRILLTGKFSARLQAALSGPLPGNSAHLKMASRLRREKYAFNHDTSTAIQSSVLILLYPFMDEVTTVFIRRQTYDGVHSGQISFPGGRTEPGDQNRIDTALREASEEVNIDPAQVAVIGTLTELYIPPSNYLVLPVVGISSRRPKFVPERTEVAEIIESGLGFLFDKNQRKETRIVVRGTEIEAPYFDVDNHMVWGATAMILSELSDVISSIT